MRIIALKVGNLINQKHFTFMQFVLNNASKFVIVKQLFATQLAVFKAAFDKENEIFLKHNRSFLTPAVQQADEARDRKFRIVYDSVKTATLLDDEAKREAAEFLMKVIKDYGGIRIGRLPVDAESGALTNLSEDLLEKYEDKVELLGLKAYVLDMQAANDEYIKLSADRTWDESQTDKQAMVKSRKETDDAYRGFVDSVNLYVKYNGDGELLPFIKFMNKEIERYRVQLGQSVGNPDWGGDAVLPDEEESPDDPTPSIPGEGEDEEAPNNPDNGNGSGESGELNPSENVTVQWVNRSGRVVKEMVVPKGGSVSLADYPEVADGWEWSLSWGQVNARLKNAEPGSVITVNERVYSEI